MLNKNMWGLIINNLQLQGLSKVLAENCVFASYQDGEILVLELDRAHLPLLNEKNREKIECAIRTVTGQNISLNIIVSESAPHRCKYIRQTSIFEVDENGRYRMISGQMQEVDQGKVIDFSKAAQ